MIMMHLCEEVMFRFESLWLNQYPCDLKSEVLNLLVHVLIEPPHDKTNNMTCAPNVDSDQPGHLPSLIRVFAVCMKIQ